MTAPASEAPARRSPRFPSDLPIQIKYFDGAAAGRALNVSRDGIFAATHALRDRGTVVRVTVHIDDKPIDLIGFVAREERSAMRPQGVGIALTMTTEAWTEHCDALAKRA
jgi:hypothetical protein